jgi:hypothetical protein
MSPLLSNRGGMLELLNWMNIGQSFDPENIDSIVQAIDRAVTIGDRNLNNRLNDFTESEYLRQIVPVYESLL